MKSVLPKTKTCTCGKEHKQGQMVDELLTKEGKRIPGQFWFNCSCHSTIFVMVK